MEHVIQLHIEKLPEGVYLATGEEIQSLVAQDRTIEETLEIARGVAKKLIEARAGTQIPPLPPAREVYEYSQPPQRHVRRNATRHSQAGRHRNRHVLVEMIAR